MMGSRIKFLAISIVAIVAISWWLFVRPEFLKLGNKLRYDAGVISVDNFYDPVNQEFVGEQYSRTVYNFIASGQSGKHLQITNTFDVKSLDGRQIFKAQPTYLVDPYTRIGTKKDSPTQTGYVFPPKNLKKGQGFDYWHVTSRDVISMKYSGEEKINGLTVYKYEKKDIEPSDQTALLDFLPDVPEKKGVKLVSNIYLWVEPVSGFLVKIEDFSQDYYYYDIKTGQKLYPYNQFLNTYNQESLIDLTRSATIEKYKHLFINRIVLALFALCIIFILYFEKIVTPNKVNFIRTHYKTILLTLFLVLSFSSISYYVYQNNLKQRNDYFEDRVREANLILDKQINIYISAILGGKGLFEASDYVDHKEWESYVKSIDLDKNYSGVLGIGYSAVFSASESSVFLAEQKKIHGDSFKVYPDGQRDLYTSIIYLEPKNERNRKAIGFDMYTEDVRRSAMKKAVLTKSPSMSGKVTLVQEIDQDVQPGFLIYVPIFSNGKLTGFVYSPFRTKDLINSIFENIKTDLTIKIYDGLKVQPENLLYDRHPNSNNSTIFKKNTTIYLAGHPWTIEYANSPEYKQPFINYVLPYLIFLFGLLISSILWIVQYSLSVSEEKAIAYAKKVNQELENSQQSLIQKNKELEEKIEEANSLNKVMVGRELKMIELKRKIDQHYD